MNRTASVLTKAMIRAKRHRNCNGGLVALTILCGMAATLSASAQSLASRAWDIAGQTEVPANGRIDSITVNWHPFKTEHQLPSPAFRVTSDTLPASFDLRHYLRPTGRLFPAHDSTDGSFFLPDSGAGPEKRSGSTPDPELGEGLRNRDSGENPGNLPDDNQTDTPAFCG